MYRIQIQTRGASYFKKFEIDLNIFVFRIFIHYNYPYWYIFLFNKRLSQKYRVHILYDVSLTYNANENMFV